MPSLIRLCPRPFTSLPSHPAFNEAENNPNANDTNDTNDDTITTTTTNTTAAAQHRPRPDLRSFLHTALTEAQNFLVTTIPRTFKMDGKPRASPPATAKVQLLNRVIRAEEQELDHAGSREDEFWVCRRSVHLDAPVDGTASWEEFQGGLRENHSENEMAYTPSLSGVERLLEWPMQDQIEGGWKQVDMHVTMLTHTFNPQTLISPRTFISLIISALLPPSSPITDSGGWVTIQIPLAHDPVNSIPESIRSKIVASAPKNTIFASYASIERLVSLSPPRRGSSSTTAAAATGAGTNNSNSNTTSNTTSAAGGGLDVTRTLSRSRRKVEWTLATTSDPGGSVPQWVQRSWVLGGVPKAVVKDVGLFIGWVDRKRQLDPNDEAAQ